jgi:DNA-binding MarR family transcriptional regulator
MDNNLWETISHLVKFVNDYYLGPQDSLQIAVHGFSCKLQCKIFVQIAVQQMCTTDLNLNRAGRHVMFSKKRKPMKKQSTTHQFPPLTVSLAPLLTRGRDHRFRSMVDGLVQFAGQIQNVREVLSRAMGVTQPQYRMLMIIAHDEGDSGITVGEMAKKMDVSPSFVVVETNKLLGDGLIYKKVSTVDRRRINLQLTDKAIALVTKIGLLQRNVNDVLFGRLDRHEFEALISTVEKLVASYGPALDAARGLVATIQKKPRA